MMLWDILTLIGGLIVLGIGGEALVRGASGLARSLGISALVVGLTVVAFGTSAPELAVSVTSCLKDQDALAIGNVVGSNIANVLLVLGLAALVRPLAISLNVLRVDSPVMLGSALLFAAFSLAGGAVLRWQGVVLLAVLIAYLYLTYVLSRREPRTVKDEYDQALAPEGSRILQIVMILVGLAGLKYGADFIVSGAVGIAEQFRLSPRLIGMTIVAVGTSLPEIATCIVAARRGQPDIAIGNIVGSNIFNILSVIGVAAVVAAPVEVAPAALHFDVPVMIVTMALAWPMMWTGRRITRGEGLFLLALYAGYLIMTVRKG